MNEIQVNGRLRQRRGKWICSLNWIDKNGQRQFREKSTGLPITNNKRKAGEILSRFIEEVGDEVNQPELPQFQAPQIQSALFSDYVRFWLESIEGTIDENTYCNYAKMAKNHVLPYFDRMRYKVKDISLEVLQSFFNDQRKTGRMDGTGGLGAASLKTINIILRGATNIAFTSRGQFNPLTLVKTPPREKGMSGSAYSVEECDMMLDAFKGDMMYPLVKATVLLGLRRSEILGLKWDAIDFLKKTITIRHVVVRTSDNKVIAKDKTKTASSARVYAMPRIIYDLFAELKQVEDDNRTFFGDTYIENAYIFKWPNGKRLDPGWVTRTFTKKIKKFGLPQIRFHDLRHSCASVLYSRGMGVKEIQMWLGHSSATVTLDIYTHLFKNAGNQVADCIDQAFQGCNDTTNESA